MELALATLALVASLVLVARGRSAAGRAIAGLCVATALAGAAFRAPAPDVELSDAVPAPRRDGGFVSSATCRVCHPFQHASWQDSYHRTMTQVASPAAVLGDFDDVTLKSRGRTTRLWREGDEFWVDVVDPLWDFRHRRDPLSSLPPDPPRVTARVVMTTGSHHLQTYWIRRPDDPARVGADLPSDDGALHQLPWIWHIEEGRWIPTQDSFLTPPRSRTAAGTPWNTSCSPCHSVGTQPHLVRETFDTTTAELGIACEACHGPGAEHVAANRDPLRRYLRHFDADADDPTIVNPARLDKTKSAQVCGQCHSFHQEIDLDRAQVGGVSFRAGDALEDHKRVFTLRTDREDPVLARQLRAEPDAMEGRFWKDGTIRVAGREYNGLLESPCHTVGEMTCLSCHALHDYVEPSDQLLPEAVDDRACTRCHPEVGADVEGHTHHPVGTTGAACMNCHMPYTTWGLFTAMRSHRIDSPSARVSLETGRPNACSQCHVDQPLTWTAAKLTEWYGQESVDLPREHREVAASIVWALTGDAAQRAIAAWTMGWTDAKEASGSGWQAVYLSMLLADPYASVRKAAYDALRELPGFEDFEYDFLPDGPAQMPMANQAMRRWASVRGVSLDRRGDRVLIDENGDPLQERIMELHARRDDTPVRIIE